jgi:type II secretory pathway pseudopilin PulG
MWAWADSEDPMQQLRHARLRLDDESGMSLLEVIIAMFVLAVSILGLASVASASLVSVRASRDRQAATDVATSMLEFMRLSDFGSIAMLDADADGKADGPGASCDGGTDGEPYVLTTNTSTDAHLRYQDIGLGAGENITLTTIVTWYDDPADGVQACADVPKETKRVRVTATWTDGTTTRSVVEETLVSPADRGLPLPAFQIGNPAASQHFPKEWVYGDSGDTGGNGWERCVSHTLRNIGAPDRYEVSVVRSDAVTHPEQSPKITNVPVNGDYGYAFPNAGKGDGQGTWYVRTELEYPVASGTIDRFDAPGTQPRSVKGDDAVQVATSDQATLRLCFTPTSNVQLSSTYTLRTTVYSRFDPSVSTAIDHTLTTGSAATKWFLYDTDDTQDHERTSGVIYTMGPEQGAQPDRLGVSSSLHDYDTNVGDGHPGLQLTPTVTVARWHEQLTANTTFRNTVDLVLWVSNDDALDGDPVPTGGWLQRLKVDIKRLKPNESGVVDTWVSNAALDWTHTETRVSPDDGWQEIRWTLTLTSANGLPIEVKKNEFVQLVLRCEDVAEDPHDEECQLAYDHVDYPSRLEITPTS